MTQRGLARVVLLGDPVTVTNEAKKAGADISRCAVVDPQVCWGVGCVWVFLWGEGGVCLWRWAVNLCVLFVCLSVGAKGARLGSCVCS